MWTWVRPRTSTIAYGNISLTQLLILTRSELVPQSTGGAHTIYMHWLQGQEKIIRLWRLVLRAAADDQGSSKSKLEMPWHAPSGRRVTRLVEMFRHAPLSLRWTWQLGPRTIWSRA